MPDPLINARILFRESVLRKLKSIDIEVLVIVIRIRASPPHELRERGLLLLLLRRVMVVVPTANFASRSHPEFALGALGERDRRGRAMAVGTAAGAVQPREGRRARMRTDRRSL
jgi:hypothetical protein